MNTIGAGENLAIGIGLYMRDGFTANAARASSAMRNLRGNADDLARSQATSVRNMNAVGAAAGGVLINGIGKAYKEFASFNYLMKFTALAADDNTKALGKLSNKAMEVGNRTIFDPAEVAEGMRWMAQAGMSSKDILSTIDTAANLAAATNSALNGEKGAADMLAKITASFQIPRTAANMSRVSDILGIGANKSLTDLTKFGEGMTYAQTTAMRLKMTLEETTAAVMVLSNTGIQGTVTGTTLDNMARYIADAAGGRRPKAQKALASLGLGPEDLQDAQGNLKPFGTILGMLGDRMRGLGTVAKNNIAIDIFGVRGAKGTLLMDNIAKYNEFLRETQTNIGYTKRTADQLMDSDQGAIDRMQSNWQSLKIQFGETVAPLITPILNFASKALDAIGRIVSTPIGGLLAKIGTAFLVIKTAQMAYHAILLTIRLTQGTLGMSMMGAAAQTTSSYGTMNTAATAYSNTLMRLRMLMTATSGVGRVGQYSHGGYYQVGPGGGYMPLGRNSYKPGLAKGNAFMGKAALPMMIGGLGLSMAAGSNPADGWGKTAAVAGDTLSYAASGAMLGSIIPGVGTLAGGVVGGLIGLFSGIKTHLQDLDENIDGQKEKLRGPVFDKGKWLNDVDVYNSMKYKDRMYNMNGSRVLDNNYKPMRGGRDNTGVETSINIYIDGKTAMSKTYDDNNVKELINLGLI